MFTKFAILVFIVAVVWFGFRYLDRRDRIGSGNRRVGERSFTERLRKATRGKEGPPETPDTVEDTESCPTCGAFVSVEGVTNCGKPNCPY
jgi:hypothetical protein